MMAVLGALAIAGTMASGVALAPRALAQGPAQPRKIYTNRTAFKLPLQVDDQERTRLREVQLYVKNGPSGTWNLKESVPPTQKEFILRGLQDGEYWFTLVTVDKSGQLTPVDLTQEPPALIVIIDKQPPEVDVHPLAGGPGQTLLQCDVRDANPDLTKTKLEYLAADRSWKALEPVPNQVGLFQASDPAALHGVIRATAADRAGNTTTREINLHAATVTPTVEVNNIAPAPTEIRTDKLPVPPVEIRPEKLPPPIVDMKPERLNAPATDVKPDKVPPPTVEIHSDKALTSFNPEPTATATGAKHAGPVRQFVNSTHATLKYQIDQTGPSGIGKVEVWITQDDGQTWRKLCDDPRRKSPVEIDLPGEGVFGISLAVTNGNGNGGEPPAKGDTPDWLIEVDTTKPAAQLKSVHPGTGTEVGQFVISWTASDKNLKSAPVDLMYANKIEGPWLPIVKGLKNDGMYKWPGPRDETGQFYVRLEVSDQAGNSTVCTTPQPVILDRSRPKAHVIGVVAGNHAN
jgi:hypothetical protein